MPAAITHYLHGQSVLRKLQIENEVERDSFLWGAQGPDFFFGHRIFPWQKGERLGDLGGRFHNEPPGATLSALKEFCSQSYFYGFLCHYALDRTCHPFIRFGASAMAAQHPEDSENICHHRIESALDIIMLRWETGQLACDFDLKKTLPKNPVAQKEIAEGFHHAIRVLFSREIPDQLILQAENDYRTALGLLNDKFGLKKRFIEHWEKRMKKGHVLSCHFRDMLEEDEYDYANVCHGEWGKGELLLTKDFFELYHDAVDDAARLILGSSDSNMDILTGGVPFS